MRSLESEAASRLERCLREIAEKLKPSERESTLLESEMARVREALSRALERVRRKEQVLSIEPQGSFARDTWLSGDVDIDIFLIFSRETSLEAMWETTQIACELAAEELGAGLEVRYATHPYYVLKLNSVEVEVVPAYQISSPSELITPVDRTPHHTAFVRKALNEKPHLKADIRLFKKLLKNIGVYGAETWVGGFSGYLAEILIIHHGGLIPLLRAAAGWRPGRVFIPDTVESRRFKSAPLVVLDPVDPTRNASAAVSQEAVLKLAAVARLVTLKEDLLCCFLDPPELAIEEELVRSLWEQRSFLIISAVNSSTLPQDALKGRLTRVARRLRAALEREGFNVYRHKFIELSSGFLLAFELESMELSRFKKHLGPPIWSPSSIPFLEKWISQHSGPYLEGYRWAVTAPRKIRSARGVARAVLNSYKELKWDFLDVGDVLKRCTTEEDRKKLYTWLTGVEEWMLCLQDLPSGA